MSIQQTQRSFEITFNNKIIFNAPPQHTPVHSLSFSLSCSPSHLFKVNSEPDHIIINIIDNCE